ncbi:MAG: AbrB/MazE/SpoVT family DNA-binding domain-containing protein [Mycobacteriales bacterium]
MHRTRVDQNGRVLVPASIRRALGLREGSELLVTLEPDGRVALVPHSTAWARVQALTEGVERRGSVVEELLRERRTEARREDASGSVDDLLGR